MAFRLTLVRFTSFLRVWRMSASKVGGMPRFRAGSADGAVRGSRRSTSTTRSSRRLCRSSAWLSACNTGSGNRPFCRIILGSTERFGPAMRPGAPTTVAPVGTGLITTEPAPIRVVFHGGRAQNRRWRADDDVVSADGMALCFPGPVALVYQPVVVDPGRLPDHHTHAVVNEEEPADPGPRMNLHASLHQLRCVTSRPRKKS